MIFVRALNGLKILKGFKEEKPQQRGHNTIGHYEKKHNFVMPKGPSTLGITYFLMKVFPLLSRGKKSDSFNEKGMATALIICVGMRIDSISYTGVEFVFVYSFQGFVRASYQINGSRLHTFFVYTIWHIRSRGQAKQYYYALKTFGKNQATMSQFLPYQRSVGQKNADAVNIFGEISLSCNSFGGVGQRSYPFRVQHPLGRIINR